MSVFFQWQIICYLCGFDAGYRSLQRIEMLITIAILTILGLLFGKITIKEIKEYVMTHMAKHKTPKYVMFVDAFPMNAAGKILKYKMREEAAERLGLIDPMKKK